MRSRGRRPAIECGAPTVEGHADTVGQSALSPHEFQSSPQRTKPTKHHKRRSAARFVDDHQSQITRGEFAMYYDI
jgi:hypothetical protein